jgi:hypothetical protein
MQVDLLRVACYTPPNAVSALETNDSREDGAKTSRTPKIPTTILSPMLAALDRVSGARLTVYGAVYIVPRVFRPNHRTPVCARERI